mgnify:CR=1 FL=1
MVRLSQISVTVLFNFWFCDGFSVSLAFEIFAKYSKPTKEFRWTVENEDGYAENIYGFNANLANSAISFAIEMLT